MLSSRKKHIERLWLAFSTDESSDESKSDNQSNEEKREAKV